MSTLSTSTILSHLSTIRSNPSSPNSTPEEIINYGKILLERNYFKNSPDDGWNLLEQLCIASIECQEFALASVCAKRLSTRFPNSPRVELLNGLILEGKGVGVVEKDAEEAGDVEEGDEGMKAELFYVDLIKKGGEEGGDLLIQKRRIALHLNSSLASLPSSSSSISLLEPIKPNRATGLQLLLEHLSIYSNDIESWSKLSDLYSSLGLYEQSLTALNTLILLAPQNSIYLLKHSETLYTLGEYHIAYLEFLRVIEMDDTTSRTGEEGKGGGKVGVKMRACLGAKLCLQKLPSSKITKEIDLFLTESILSCHSNTSSSNKNDVGSKKLMSDWLSC